MENAVPYGVVYVIQNHVTGKSYVGQTTQQCDVRFQQHIRRIESSHCKALASAIKKYGSDAFCCTVVFEATDQRALDLAEIDFINRLGTVAPAGYNLRDGGSAGKHSAATCRKISEALKGRGLSDQQKQRMRDRMLGTSPSQGTRAKIRAALIGRSLSEETRRKMGLARVGKRHTDESKRKMSANRSGVPVSEAMRERLRAANIGKRHTKETKERMRASQLARWAKR